ncbi:MAG: hypothetical protein LBT15_01585 [Synergistaceae bacterium]|nr:hypothetical protein [Synergistaceae bacterium]
MTTATARPTTDPISIWDMTRDDMEAAFAKATERAQKELHAKGSPYIIGDADGTYAVYPDGRRIFTPYENK